MISSLVTVSSPDAKSESSKEQFLFLTADNSEVELYPYNIDPTTVNSLHNGVKLYVDGIREIHNLYSEYYLLVTNNGI